MHGTRSSHLHFWLLLVLWVLPAATLSARTALRDPDTYFFNTGFGDFQQELATAREEGKDGIMLFFEQADCPFCHRMRETVLNRPRVQDYFRRHFRLFTVDIDGDILIRDFQGREISEKDFAFRRYRVRATPVILFFDLQGKPVVRYTGATSGVDEFLWLGEYVAQKLYRKMPFTRYKRARRHAARPR